MVLLDVTMVLLGVARWFLSGCYGVARWLLFCCSVFLGVARVLLLCC